MSKTCSKCGKAKTAEEFCRDKRKPDGLAYECRPCKAVRTAAYRVANNQKMKLRRAAYRALNKDKTRAEAAAYRADNKGRIAALGRLWRRENPEYVRAAQARRRAAKLCATPLWGKELTEFVVLEACRLAKLRAAATGFVWHVDHVIPLRNKYVCGLHTWSNLAVIPAAANRQKRSKFLNPLPQPLDYFSATGRLISPGGDLQRAEPQVRRNLSDHTFL